MPNCGIPLIPQIGLEHPPTPLGVVSTNLREDNDLCARVASLTRKLEAMELRKVNGFNTVPKIDKVFRICETMEHPTNEFPTILAFKEVLHDQAN